MGPREVGVGGIIQKIKIFTFNSSTEDLKPFVQSSITE